MVSDIVSGDRHDEQAGPADPDIGYVRRMRRLLVEILRAETDRTLAQRTAMAAFVIRASSAALALVSQIVMARWLGTYEFGLYAFAFVALVLAGGLIPLGLPSAGQRFIAEYSEAGKVSELRGYLFGGRVFVVVFGTVMAVLGMLGLWLFGDLMESGYILPLYLIMICLPAYALTDIQDGISRNYSWIDLALALPYLARPVIILCIVGGTILATGAADAVTAAFALITAVWFTGIVQFVLLEIRLSRTVPRGPRVFEWKRWFVTALPIFMVESFYVLLTNTDVLILSIYRSPAEVGVYYAAIKTLALISFVPFAVTAASAHKYAEYGASGDRDKLESFVRDTVSWTFWPALGAALVMLLAGRPLLWLFGPEFVTGYPLLFILVIGLMARATVGPIDRVLNMLGQQNMCATIYACAFGLNVALNFALIPVFGMAGAASATTIALIVESIALFYFARSRLGLHIFIVDRKGRG